MKYLLIGIMVALFVTSCSSQQVTGAGRLALEAKVADLLISSGEAPDVVISIGLSVRELDAMDRALDTYTAFRTRWANASDDPAFLLSGVVALRADYAGLYSAYLSVMQITLNHWGEYDSFQQSRLEGFHARAQAIHADVNSLLASQQRAEAVQTVLQIGLILAKTAAL